MLCITPLDAMYGIHTCLPTARHRAPIESVAIARYSAKSAPILFKRINSAGAIDAKCFLILPCMAMQILDSRLMAATSIVGGTPLLDRRRPAMDSIGSQY